MAQDSPGWRYFRQYMSEKAAERRMEKAQEHEWEMYFVRQEEQKRQQQRQRTYQTYRDTTQMFLNSYNDANTPAEKEVIRNNWLEYSERMPRDMRQGIEVFLKNSPLSSQKMGDAAWLKQNPSPPMPSFKPEENMQRYARMMYDREIHKAQFAKERRGQSYLIPEEIPLDGDTFASLDAQGNVRLGKYETKNKFFDQLAEGEGMSGYALQQREGWGRPKMTTVYRTDPETGRQYQDIVEIQHNALTGERRVQKVFSGDVKKGTSEKVDRQGALSDPKQPAHDLMTYLQAGEAPPDNDPVLQTKYKEIDTFMENVYENREEIIKDFKVKNPEASEDEVNSVIPTILENRLNKELQGLDSRFVYSIINPKEENAFVPKKYIRVWKNKFKLGENAFIIPIYGRLSTLQTKDKRLITVVIDDQHNRISTRDGISLGTIAGATSLFGSHTKEELKQVLAK